MAEYAVGVVAEKLTTLLIQEAVSLNAVKQKVERLKNELRWIQSVIKDAEAQNESKEILGEWVSDLRDAAYEAEDIIETYISKAVAEDSWNILSKPLYIYRVGKQIDDMHSKILEIAKRREVFGVPSSQDRGGSSSSSSRENDMLRWWRQPLPQVREEDVIELKEDTSVLVDNLTRMERNRGVVSIVGMAGLGKTTLAKKLYNLKEIIGHFEWKVWVYVSKEYRRKEILQEMVKNIHGLNRYENNDLDKLKEDELLKILHDFLEDKRYLVVLDDIWTTEVWDSLQAAFPSGCLGSKVMITTRNKEVALYAGSSPHEPRNLTEDESLKLLQKKACPEMYKLPPDLEKLGRELVAKCKGLPLAVVVIGGLLSKRNKSVEEWSKVLHNISWHLIKGQDRVSGILALSYNDLSCHLKSCFLYMGLFPEDFSVRTKKLIQLWVAEGFLPQGWEESAEDVAERCLTELIHRCMIQVGERSSLGRVKTVRIHDLLRDLAISKAQEENFLQIHQWNRNGSSASHPPKSRRHGIHTRYDNYAFLKHFAPHSRSVLFFNRDHNDYAEGIQVKVSILKEQYKANFMATRKLDFIYKKFKLLRVLEFDGLRLVSLPSTIGDLIQLRYLGLRRTKLEEELPASIGKLQNLETLDLRYSYFLKRIPNVIWKMVRLRHLLLYTPFDPPESGHLRLDTLSNLQTLPYIEAGSWIEDGALVNMINLRNLGIGGLSGERVRKVVNDLERLHNLQSLSLTLLSQEEVFPQLNSLCKFGRLQKLSLCGRMEKLPEPQQFPPNLIKLTLSNTKLQEGATTKLEKLPNLRMLIMGPGSYVGKQWVCSAGGFPQLEVLKLRHLKELEQWKVEEGALVSLKHLEINSCEELSSIPHGLKTVTALNKIELIGMPISFEDRLRSEHISEFKTNPSVRSTTDIMGMVQRDSGAETF